MYPEFPQNVPDQYWQKVIAKLPFQNLDGQSIQNAVVNFSDCVSKGEAYTAESVLENARMILQWEVLSLYQFQHSQSPLEDGQEYEAPPIQIDVRLDGRSEIIEGKAVTLYTSIPQEGSDKKYLDALEGLKPDNLSKDDILYAASLIAEKATQYQGYLDRSFSNFLRRFSAVNPHGELQVSSEQLAVLRNSFEAGKEIKNILSFSAAYTTVGELLQNMAASSTS